MKRIPSQWYRDLGIRLRQRRHVLGLTAAQSAAPLNVSLQMYQKYERGAARLPIDRAITIARFFRMDLLALLAPETLSQQESHPFPAIPAVKREKPGRNHK